MDYRMLQHLFEPSQSHKICAKKNRVFTEFWGYFLEANRFFFTWRVAAGRTGVLEEKKSQISLLKEKNQKFQSVASALFRAGAASLGGEEGSRRKEEEGGGGGEKEKKEMEKKRREKKRKGDSPEGPKLVAFQFESGARCRRSEPPWTSVLSFRVWCWLNNKNKTKTQPNRFGSSKKTTPVRRVKLSTRHSVRNRSKMVVTWDRSIARHPLFQVTKVNERDFVLQNKK